MLIKIIKNNLWCCIITENNHEALAETSTLPVVKPDGTPVMPESETAPTLAPAPSASATGAMS